MGHVEPSHLAELALGHASSDADAVALRHVASCRPCREELKLMTRVVTAARDAEASDLPTAPPERVWQRIARELSHGAHRLPHSIEQRPGRRHRSPWWHRVR
ncbi:hypothetical protein [Streptomyces sp. E2N166]|uniref:hypothetical protein n=1 Tax=Streptomyces sp. E2N166 TaxID=1851909 RepID=UPI001EE8868F|nr:hypothetical protein [Streptomyces sp. E2N166]